MVLALVAVLAGGIGARGETITHYHWTGKIDGGSNFITPTIAPGTVVSVSFVVVTDDSTPGAPTTYLANLDYSYAGFDSRTFQVAFDPALQYTVGPGWDPFTGGSFASAVQVELAHLYSGGPVAAYTDYIAGSGVGVLDYTDYVGIDNALIDLTDSHLGQASLGPGDLYILDDSPYYTREELTLFGDADGHFTSGVLSGFGFVAGVGPTPAPEPSTLALAALALPVLWSAAGRRACIGNGRKRGRG
jgi:hypothetical protein